MATPMFGPAAAPLPVTKPLAAPKPAPYTRQMANQWAAGLNPTQRKAQDVRLDAITNQNRTQQLRDMALGKYVDKPPAPPPNPARPGQWNPSAASAGIASQAVNAPIPKGSTASSPQMSPSQLALMKMTLPQAAQYNAEDLSIPASREIVAPFTAAQTQGQQMALQEAGAQGQLAGQAAGAVGSLTDPNFLANTSAPLEAGAISAATRPITQQLTESTLPSLRSGAAAAGQYGSSRQGIAEGLASQAASQATGDTAAKIAESSYQSNLDAMTKALGLAPSISSMQTAPAVTTSGVGEVQQAQQQAEDTASLQRDMYNWNIPMQKAGQEAALAYGQPTGTATTASAAKPSLAQQILSGAGLGATIGSAIPGVGTAVGAGAGAGIGPLLYALSG